MIQHRFSKATSVVGVNNERQIRLILPYFAFLVGFATIVKKKVNAPCARATHFPYLFFFRYICLTHHPMNDGLIETAPYFEDFRVRFANFG